MVRWKERLARSPGCAALTRAADLAGRTPREMPRVRCAYPGYRLAGRSPRGKPRVRCAYLGHRLAGRVPREMPRVRCAYPGYMPPWIAPPGRDQARIPALAHPHAWASNPQNRTRPGKTRALFVSDKRNKKNRPAARHCATPDDLTSLLASCLPPASCPYGFLVCRPPGDPQSLWRGIHCCRPGIQCLNASPPVEQLGSLPLSWQRPLRPSPRSGRDSVRPSSIRFPSPAPTPRRS